MRWLGEVRYQDGVAAILLALLLVPLLGIAALVIDVGLMYWEVRQLQNGADAAALAIAQECAERLGCTSTADATAATLADGNANDASTDATVAFGTEGPGTVTVTATTDDAEGSGRLTFTFARALGFDSGIFSRTATATWGPPVLESAIPLTISECEWDLATDGGVSLPSATTVIEVKGNPGTNECLHPNRPGLYQPGGFGWLDPTLDGCEASLALFGVRGDTGSGPPSPDCTEPRHDWSALLGTTVTVPIHHTSTGSGANTTFDMAGLGAFRITSFQVGGGSPYTAGPMSCPGTGENQRCLIGTFEEFVTLDGVVDPDGADLGVRTVQLIG